MSPRIPLAGVIGHPVAHSKSPALHGYWLKTLGLSGYYIPMEVSHQNLGRVLKALPSMGFVGANVTIPHKESVLSFADQVTDRAALIGAANTLTFGVGGRVIADNTDGYGFIENLRQSAPSWSPESGPAVVLGAGGAARAIVSALLDANVPEIRIANRTKARATTIKADFGTKLVVYDWVRAGEMLDGASLLVNTTSLGMTGQGELKVPLNLLNPATLVTDIVYTPLITPLLAAAADRGCQVVDGLGMLLHQGVPGFERWFGKRPQVDDQLRAAILDP